MDVDFLFILSGLMFGLIIGYLAWYAVMPGVKEVNLNTVSAFIGVVAGAAITTLFPSGSQVFIGYTFGLAIGFFGPVIKRHRQEIERAYELQQHEKQAKELAEQQKKKELFAEEINQIDANWAEIEALMLKLVNNFPNRVDAKISANQLPFDSYSNDALNHIMKKFAAINEDWEYRKNSSESHLTRVPEGYKKKKKN